MMGLKDWIKGSKTLEPAPLTIQQLEQLLMKRKASHGESITLIIDGISYAMITKADHERLIKALDALEHLVKRLGE
jgi:hypothetical protein